jgi:hypothetical protein
VLEGALWVARSELQSLTLAESHFQCLVMIKLTVTGLVSSLETSSINRARLSFLMLKALNVG